VTARRKGLASGPSEGFARAVYPANHIDPHRVVPLRSGLCYQRSQCDPSDHFFESGGHIHLLTVPGLCRVGTAARHEWHDRVAETRGVRQQHPHGDWPLDWIQVARACFCPASSSLLQRSAREKHSTCV
jgi:hypothetical protein